MDTFTMPWGNAKGSTPFKPSGEWHQWKWEWPGGEMGCWPRWLHNVYPESRNVGAFFLPWIPVKTTEAYLGEHINMMVQALYAQDGTLPTWPYHAKYVTELRKGGKKAVVVVQNHTVYLQTLCKKTLWGGAMPIQLVPNPLNLGVYQFRTKDQNLKPQKLMIRQSHGKLFDELDLSGFVSWTPELADKACWLLAKYYDIFSLDPVELGCTHCTEHSIKVTDDTPFKECFRQIPPPMVEEVRKSSEKMLESGVIRPSPKSVVIQVRKKDGGLNFCINIQCLNTCTKKDF